MLYSFYITILCNKQLIMAKLRFKDKEDYRIILSLFDNYYTYLPNNPTDVPNGMDDSIKNLRNKFERYSRLGFKSMSINKAEIDAFKFIGRNLDYTCMSEIQKDFAIIPTIL